MQQLAAVGAKRLAALVVKRLTTRVVWGWGTMVCNDQDEKAIVDANIAMLAEGSAAWAAA